MPKLTNDFQRLVALVQSQVAGDSIVTESDMVPSLTDGPPREVDVTVRYPHGDHEVVVAIEAVAHRRKANVEWVERMQGKHRDLATDKLILYSASGFTANAHRSAKISGIELVSKTDLTVGSESPFGGVETLQLVRRGHIARHWSGHATSPERGSLTIELDDAQDLVDHDGRPIGLHIGQVLAHIGTLYRTQLGEFGGQEIEAGAMLPFVRHYQFPAPGLTDPEGNQIEMAIIHDGVRCKVSQLDGVFLHYALTRDVSVEYSRIGSDEIAHVIDPLEGASIRMIASGKAGQERLTVQWDDEAPITWDPDGRLRGGVSRGPTGDL